MPTAKQIHREGVMRAAGRQPRCALRHEAITNLSGIAIAQLAKLAADLGPCSGRLQADHPIDVQRIDKWLRDARRDPFATRFAGLVDDEGRVPTLDELVADARNGWLLCELHHEVVRTRKLRRVPALLLPPSVQQFGDETGLAWSLDRDFD